MNYDVVVVGAGIAGLMTAIELRQSGLAVCIIEQGQAGRESSWAGGGILSPLYPWRYPEPVNLLAQWSTAHYPDYLLALQDDTGIDPEYIGSGHLILDTDMDAADVSRWQEQFAIHTEYVDKSRLQEIEPTLAGDYERGLYLKDIGQIRNPRLIKALLEKTRQLHIPLRENTAFLKPVYRDKRIAGMQSSTGNISSENILICAGAWSGGLTLENPIPPPVVPVKGQMLQFQTTPGTLKSITLNKHHYVIPRKDGKVLAGSTVEHSNFDKTTTKQAADTLKQQTCALFPALSSANIIRHWAGLRPGNPRHTPYICQHPEITGLYYNTGHYRNGIVLGPASARLAADIILNRPPIISADAYQL